MNRTIFVCFAFPFVVFLTHVFPVFAEEMPPVYEAIDPYLATPVPGHLYEIPVVIMRFLPTADGENLDVSQAADYFDLGEISLAAMKTQIDVFDRRIKFMLEEGSRFRGYKDAAALPSLGYRVVEYITIYEQIPPGPIIHYKEGYPIYAADFHQIFDRFNMEQYVNNLGVKEIWVWMGQVLPTFPSYDPALHKPEAFRDWWESNMSSPLTGDISNSNRDNTDLPVYNSTYTVYGQNFRRTQAEAIHNHGHQLEAILSHVNHLQYGNMDLFWKKFVGQDADENFITGRAGWTHMPPNTTIHYDYTGTGTPVESDIEAWTPDNSGLRKLVNFETYGDLTYPWPDPHPAAIPQRVESQWYLYWMQSMPGYKNQIRYNTGNMTNWWVFTADWDTAIASHMGLVSQTVTELPQLRVPDDAAKPPVDLDTLDLNLLPDLKSKGHATETAIRFFNRTGSDIAYYWIDYEGKAIFHRRLAADTAVNQPTYAGHIWLVKDAKQRNLAVFRAVAETGRALIHIDLTSPIVHLRAVQRPPMYWVDAATGSLHRLVAAEIEEIAPTVQGATCLTVDTAHGLLYFAVQTDAHKTEIRRSHLDGSDLQTLSTLPTAIVDIAVNASGERLYWTDTRTRIQTMATSENAPITAVVTGRSPPTALAVSNGYLYWGERAGNVRRVRLTAAQPQIENIATGLGAPHGIAIATDAVYWVESDADGGGKLRRATVDGTDIQVLKTFPKWVPRCLGIDSLDGQLYWTQGYNIERMALNGGAVQAVVTNLPMPTHVVLNPAADDTVLGTAPVFSDPFEGTALQNPNWQWQNEPTHWDVGETREHFLHIEGETHRDLWATDASHLLYQETDTEAFDVETHFFTQWNTFSGVNGLVVKSPADNDWVTLKLWARDPGARGHIQYQARERGLAGEPVWRPGIGETELFFRLRKDANTYTGWYKTREADPWIKIGSAHVVLTPPLYLGIYAGVAAPTGTLTVDYAYFRNTLNTSVQAAPTAHTSIAVVPTETALLPNYPNPFNPETWIPYHLTTPADVVLTIYAVDGKVVRRLDVGHQAAGFYQSKSRAAYWDGRNTLGEPVASSVYFYTLTAGEFTATRKMLILK